MPLEKRTKPLAPKYLGKQSNKPITKLDLIPWDGGVDWIDLVCTEFTSFCPVTGQPDFGKITISYHADKFLVETKSLKLFLWSYRNKPAFNEGIVKDIAKTFMQQVQPFWVEVIGQFKTRGGIELSAGTTLRSNKA